MNEQTSCPCKRSCERHGRCEECRAHHREKGGRQSLTFCERQAERRQREQKHEQKS